MTAPAGSTSQVFTINVATGAIRDIGDHCARTRHMDGPDSRHDRPVVATPRSNSSLIVRYMGAGTASSRRSSPRRRPLRQLWIRRHKLGCQFSRSVFRSHDGWLPVFGVSPQKAKGGFREPRLHTSGLNRTTRVLAARGAPFTTTA